MVEIEVLVDFVAEQSAKDHSGHDLAHIQRVVKLSAYLTRYYPQADQNVVLAAAWTHDVLDEKLVSDPTQLRVLRQRLTGRYQQAGFSAPQIEAIYAIIDHLSYAQNLRTHWQLSLAGQLVQDADRLDALGAVGIGRAFYYGASTGAPMFDPELAPRTTLDHQAYRQVTPVINHFYEKLFRLAALMNTAEARAIAEKRTAIMRQFVTDFKAEWQFDEKNQAAQSGN
ncbi:HD domain-containing protein [Lapidilactobacillus luobeiensis]|uniref:HD domain-containing protein n=1 Tax=Lapidilactobacillus luobeiensis TaxID=2950371 RepID=UPI0021C350B8|nr:HD domain-containing protein [Lapidilactobacillus luobeiensis]